MGDSPGIFKVPRSPGYRNGHLITTGLQTIKLGETDQHILNKVSAFKPRWNSRINCLTSRKHLRTATK